MVLLIHLFVNVKHFQHIKIIIKITKLLATRHIIRIQILIK